MLHAYLKTYAEACEFARAMEAGGYQTAVLLSGEVRYWRATPAVYTKIG